MQEENLIVQSCLSFQLSLRPLCLPKQPIIFLQLPGLKGMPQPVSVSKGSILAHRFRLFGRQTFRQQPLKVPKYIIWDHKSNPTGQKIQQCPLGSSHKIRAPDSTSYLLGDYWQAGARQRKSTKIVSTATFLRAAPQSTRSMPNLKPVPQAKGPRYTKGTKRPFLKKDSKGVKRGSMFWSSICSVLQASAISLITSLGGPRNVNPLATKARKSKDIPRVSNAKTRAI